MSNQSLALKHWSRILRRWPFDRVRPENVSFQKLMTQRLDRHKKHPSPSAAAAAASGVKSNEAIVSAVAPGQWNEPAELEQANALYALLEDRYAQEFKLPQALRQPASNPKYYDDLVAEMQAAPTRSWFGGVVKRIQGSLRFS